MTKRLLVLVLGLLPLLSMAADEIKITIKDHKFTPAEVRVPAGQKVKLVIENQDATPEEFESHELNREKIIAPKSKAAIWIGPLKPGKYPFMGEFNQATAKGVVIAE
jgi:plastocyanin